MAINRYIPSLTGSLHTVLDREVGAWDLILLPQGFGETFGFYKDCKVRSVQLPSKIATLLDLALTSVVDGTRSQVLTTYLHFKRWIVYRNPICDLVWV